MKKIFITLCLVLLFTTGCGKVPKLENGKDAVVSLKNGKISVDDLYEEVKNKYAVNVLIDMIDKQILNDKYKTTDEETKKIESQIEQMRAQFNTEAEYLQAIQSYFSVKDENELKELLSLDYKRGLAVEEYSKSLVTDKEVEDYYNNKTVGDMEASHILIKPKTTDGMTSEEKTKAEEEALQKAKEVITRLNNGEDFATLAKELSDDEGSKEDGGKVGKFNRNSNFVKEFIEEAIRLEEGKYSTEPVKSSFGYHIILKTSQKEKPALDKVKDDIIATLAEEKETNDTKLQYKALIDLREKSNIKIEDSELESQYNKLMNSLLTQETN